MLIGEQAGIFINTPKKSYFCSTISDSSVLFSDALSCLSFPPFTIILTFHFKLFLIFSLIIFYLSPLRLSFAFSLLFSFLSIVLSENNIRICLDTERRNVVHIFRSTRNNTKQLKTTHFLCCRVNKTNRAEIGDELLGSEYSWIFMSTAHQRL
jgi:hypothetical protein